MREPFVFDRLSSNDRPSEFFVEATTPPHGHNDTDEDDAKRGRIQRAVTMGAPNAQVDFLDAPPTEIDLQLQAKQLFAFVAATIVFYSLFTVIFFIGIPAGSVYEAIGTSKKAEEKVETYNTYSGYAMALVEVLVAVHVNKFVPVLDVYVHNGLYFLLKARATDVDEQTGEVALRLRVSRRLHSAIMFAFPIVLALTMGNSLRGLQAGQSSAGFKRVMSADDLKKEQPVLDQIRATASSKRANATVLSVASGRKLTSANETVLKNAIREQATPFTFVAKSPCGESTANATDGTSKEVADLVDTVVNSNKAARTFQMNVHDLDSTSAVYGFVPQEWNSEAITTELTPKTTFTVTYAEALKARNATTKMAPPAAFSLATAYEILVQGKLIVERAQGETTASTYPCSLSDGLGSESVVSGGSAEGSSSGSGARSATVTAPAAATTKVNGAGKATIGLPKAVVDQVHKATRRLQNSGDGSSNDVDDTSDLIDDGRNQWTYDANDVRQCEGAVSSLFDMFDFDDSAFQTVENLVFDTASIMNKTLSNLATHETTVTLETYALTTQIQLDVVRIDIPLETSVEYGLETGCPDTEGSNAAGDCDPLYAYNDGLSESFCGSDGCAFLDGSQTFQLQRQIGVLPYVTNCTLDLQHVHYSADFRGFYPSDCTKVANTAFLYGIGSYVTGDEYASNASTANVPFIKRPRRHVRMTFAKVTWQTEALDKTFDAKCGDSDKKKTNCAGLWYQLQPSGRFLFAGEDALPTKKLAKTDFRSPISLVQLNSPTLFIQKLNASVTLEPLSSSNFGKVSWPKTQNGSALRGEQCSMLVDSYLRQVDTNNYKLEQPLQVMYTAFFYYLMQDAAVTQLNDTSLALNGSNQSTIALAKTDRLGNVKLTGDKQVRSIRVSIPTSSFYTTLGGCGVVFVLMLLIVAVPARRVEHFDEGATKAEQFLVMTQEETYPDSVHKKIVLFPATGELVPFHDLHVERMVLVQEKEGGRTVYL